MGLFDLFFFPESGQKLPINHNYIEFWKNTVINISNEIY
jgi:hypothetical protein